MEHVAALRPLNLSSASCSKKRKSQEAVAVYLGGFYVSASGMTVNVTGVQLTLFSSCPYLGMLYLIISPPSRAGRFGDFLS